MGSLTRSEEMRFCQLIVEKEAAFDVVAEIGKKPYVQFKDLNPDVNNFQRMFVKDIRRYDEMERKLSRVNDGDYKVLPTSELNKLEVRLWTNESIDVFQTTLSELERDVQNMNDSDGQLRGNFNDLKEWDAVLDKTDEFFQGGVEDQAQEEFEAQDEEGLALSKAPMNYLVGIIRRDRLNGLERVLWRACHHTAYIRSADVEEPIEDVNGEQIYKAVFIVFLKGDRMRNIVEKVCDGFKARIFKNCPKTFKERQSARNDVRARMQDLQTVLSQTHEHRFRVLQAAANNFNAWLKQVRMQKTVFHHLNLFTFDGIGRFFVAECWVPLKYLDDVRGAMEYGAQRNGASVKPVLNVLETSVEPPTFNETNKFTAVFQGIVDSYGIASYRELNPAPYTIISFPFLFSCMFGDLGHGVIMFMAGLWFVLREKMLIAKNIKDEIFSMFFGGRYIILLMGIFSIHAGIVYNDLFAKSFNIFGSSWRNPYKNDSIDYWIKNTVEGKEFLLELPPEIAYDHEMGPYPFGLDPIWNIAENKLNFLNSMKMKLSVILGITQMTFGVILSLFNHLNFKSKIDIYTVFIPQMLFMGCIFIYLCIQIILKWLYFWTVEATVFGQVYPGSHCAPSLLIGLINMFMMKDRPQGFVVGTEKQNGVWTEQDSCYLSLWYPGQATIEMVLVLVAVLCIPVMLFGKPVHFLLEQKKKQKASGKDITVRANVSSENTEIVINGDTKGHEDKAAGGGGHGHEEAFGDVMVHQSIHTIEYVLGCVSHTASYLRLWALSLAHAQLSEVLWHMVFVQGGLSLEGNVLGSIVVFVVFFIFFVLTISILVLMEGLSAFLHALRLHWVEFQSKFYLGLGYPFQPFSFKEALEQAEAESIPAN